MTTTTTKTRPKLTLAERAEKLKAALADDPGIEVSLEEAKHLLICDFIEQLRNKG